MISLADLTAQQIQVIITALSWHYSEIMRSVGTEDSDPMKLALSGMDKDTYLAHIAECTRKMLEAEKELDADKQDRG